MYFCDHVLHMEKRFVLRMCRKRACISYRLGFILESTLFGLAASKTLYSEPFRPKPDDLHTSKLKYFDHVLQTRQTLSLTSPKLFMWGFQLWLYAGCQDAEWFRRKDIIQSKTVVVQLRRSVQWSHDEE